MYSVAGRLFQSSATRLFPSGISQFSSQATVDEAQQLTLKARKFANDVLRPMVVEQDQKRDISQNMLNDLMDSRLMASMVPKTFGGEGGTYTDVGSIVEELSRVDASIGFLAHVQSSLIAPLLINHGSDEQKEKYLTKIHNEWVAAQTEPELGPKSVTMFIVDKGTPGLKIDKLFTKAGFRSLPVGPVDFINVRVPKTAMLGGYGEGLKLTAEAMGFGRIGVSAQSVGMAQGAFDAAMEQIKDKVTSGKNVTSHQKNSWETEPFMSTAARKCRMAQHAIQHQLAKCATWISAARFMYQNAAKVQASNQNFVTESCMSKYFSYQMCRYVTSELLEVIGGEALMNDDNTVARFHREAIGGGVYEGNANLMLNIIARRLIKNAN